MNRIASLTITVAVLLLASCSRSETSETPTSTITITINTPAESFSPGPTAVEALTPPPEKMIAASPTEPDDHVEIPGTAISLIIPEGFALAELGGMLKHSIVTARWNPDKVIDPFEGLGFTKLRSHRAHCQWETGIAFNSGSLGESARFAV